MPIVQNRIYTTADVETMFRASEFRPTDYHSEAEAHAFTRHIGVTNAAMLLRGQAVRGDIVAITAFPDNQSAFLAGAMDLSTYGSRGQQRSVALALKLAELEYIERETGDPRGPALVVTVASRSKRLSLARIDFLGLGVSSIPAPQRLSAAMELV